MASRFKSNSRTFNTNNNTTNVKPPGQAEIVNDDDVDESMNTNNNSLTIQIQQYLLKMKLN